MLQHACMAGPPIALIWNAAGTPCKLCLLGHGRMTMRSLPTHYSRSARLAVAGQWKNQVTAVRSKLLAIVLASASPMSPLA